MTGFTYRSPTPGASQLGRRPGAHCRPELRDQRRRHMSASPVKTQISQPPTRFQQVADLLFRQALPRVRLALRPSCGLHRAEDRLAAAPAMSRYGLAFLTGTTWDPNTGQFGILPEIWGTIYTSCLALIVGTAFGVAAAIFLSEGFLSQGIFGFLKSCASSSTRFSGSCRTRWRPSSRT